jgi:hypothetical protein
LPSRLRGERRRETSSSGELEGTRQRGSPLFMGMQRSRELRRTCRDKEYEILLQDNVTELKEKYIFLGLKDVLPSNQKSQTKGNL